MPDQPGRGKTVRANSALGAERLLVAGAVLIPFLIYIGTAARALTGEDAGELVAAAHELGIPHPPGYPLWCLLAKGFTFLPIGSVAFRVALLSAAFGALTAGLLFLYLRTFGIRPALALASALLFAFSRTFWSQAVIPEVYTLNAFFLVAILYALRRWSLEGRPRFLLAAGALFGFGASHHTTVFLLGPVFLLYVLAVALRARDPIAEVRRIPLALLCAALPFTVYVYLPLRARAEPFVNWGRPETADGALSHFRREIYERGPEEPPPPRTLERTARQLAIFGKRVATEFLPLALLLVLFGLVVSLRKHLLDGALLLLVAAASSLGVIWITDFELAYEHIHAESIFWIPTYLVLAVWFGLGAEKIASGRLRLPLMGRIGISPAPVAIGAFVLAGGTLAFHFAENDRSRCLWTEDFARNIFATLDPDAVYLPSGDHNTFPPIYLQQVLGERPDVLLADKYGYFEEKILEGMTPEEQEVRVRLRGSARKRFEERWIIQHYAPRAVYFTQRRDMEDLPGWTVVPVGLVFKVIRDSPEERERALAEGDAAWGRYVWRNREGESMDFTARIIVSDRHYARGWHHLAKGEKEWALGEFHAAVGSEAAIKQMWNNCGSALAEHGVTDMALAFYQGALAIDPAYESARRNLAATYVNLGLFAEARGVLEDYLRENPRDRASLLLLASTYEKEGKYQEAVNVFSEVARLHPRDPTPWFEAGRVLIEGLHDAAQARPLLETALAIDPGRTDARALLASLEGQPLGPPPLPDYLGPPMPGIPPIPQPEVPKPEVPRTPR